MNTAHPKTQKLGVLTYLLPLSITFCASLLAISPLVGKYPTLSIGITYDLAFLAPFVYLLLIWKKNVPKITAVPFFMLGLALGTFLLPDDKKQHLDYITTYFLPVLELAVFSVVIYQIVRLRKEFEKQGKTTQDFLNRLKISLQKIIPSSLVRSVFATELAVFYYLFLKWKQPQLQSHHYTTHKKNSSTSILIGLIFVLLVETFVLHIVVVRWSELLAWILSISSIYFVFQLLAHLKALKMRPSILTTDKLHLKYGLFGEAVIELDNIAKVELTSKDLKKEGKKTEKLALLGELEAHSIALHFKSKISIEKAYGIQKECDILLFHLDEKEQFVTNLTAASLQE